MPVIGFLRSTPSAPFRHLVAAFQQGLKEEGFVEGQNVSVEYRSADNQLDRLPGLAAELVQRQVAVIVGNTPAAEVAKTATETIPIIFVTGEDPVTKGLVASLNRPSGNVTGVVFFASGHLGTKRMELLGEMVPKAAIIAVLMDPKFATELPAVEGGGSCARAANLGGECGNRTRARCCVLADDSGECGRAAGRRRSILY
jgi:putative ABC transport system substrate-binding protein